MTLIKDECNQNFIKDLFCHCTGFNVLADTAALEIKKRTSISENYILIGLSSEETSSGRPMEFKYDRQEDGSFKYIGFKIFGQKNFRRW